MTPQIPGYVIAFESTVRPLVAAIALGLIWLGAARMEAPAQSRYMTAGALSLALIAWLAIAQYLGAANVYFAATDNAVPTVLFGLPWWPPPLHCGYRETSQALSQRYRSLGSWRLKSIASPAASSSCFGRTGACPGNSRCPQELATLRPGPSPSLWLRCWRERRLVPTERFTLGAFLESPTSSWRLRWGQ
jgi:hypothetical protein